MHEQTSITEMNYFRFIFLLAGGYLVFRVPIKNMQFVTSSYKLQLITQKFIVSLLSGATFPPSAPAMSFEG